MDSQEQLLKRKHYKKFLESRNESLDTALCIEVPSSFILERMTGRRVCPSCGASYHVKFNPQRLMVNVIFVEAMLFKEKTTLKKQLKKDLTFMKNKHNH